jgi:hypothetical protein
VVEYAVLIARSSLESFAVAVDSWVSSINWTFVLYAALALIALRAAFWAFHAKR